MVTGCVWMLCRKTSDGGEGTKEKVRGETWAWDEMGNVGN